MPNEQVKTEVAAPAVEVPKVPAITLNETSMTRVRILLERATARGEAKSLDNFVEDLIDLACDVKIQRWDNSDVSKNRRLFTEALVSLNVVDGNGAVSKPDIFAKLVSKYQITGGTQKAV